MQDNILGKTNELHEQGSDCNESCHQWDFPYQMTPYSQSCGTNAPIKEQICEARNPEIHCPKRMMSINVNAFWPPWIWESCWSGSRGWNLQTNWQITCPLRQLHLVQRNFRFIIQVTQVFILQSFGIFWVYPSRNSYSSRAITLGTIPAPHSRHRSLTSGSNSPVGRTNGFPCITCGVLECFHWDFLLFLVSTPKWHWRPNLLSSELFNSQYTTPFRDVVGCTSNPGR